MDTTPSCLWNAESKLDSNKSFLRAWTPDGKGTSRDCLLRIETDKPKFRANLVRYGLPGSPPRLELDRLVQRADESKSMDLTRSDHNNIHGRLRHTDSRLQGGHVYRAPLLSSARRAI